VKRLWFAQALALTGLLAVICSWAGECQAIERLDVEACVRAAVADSAVMQEGDAKVAEYMARLKEIESVYYPKFAATLFVAPVFTVKGNGFEQAVERRFTSISDWGPYTSLEMLLTKPLYTFGRVEAGADAARARAEVERARLRESRNKIALEVRKLYYMRLLAQSMLPALHNADALLSDALQNAQNMFDEASGDVTEVDLAKLSYGAAEVKRYILVAQYGSNLALSALKHTMGWPETAQLEQADTLLPAPPQADNTTLAALIEQAEQRRPEWLQLQQGARAAHKLAEAERRANWPVLFAAGVFSGAYTPNHDADENPWHLDIYNRYAGGVAVGLKFDLDPMLARAKAQVAQAKGAQIDALKRFAQTGIPLQVKRAHCDVQRHQMALKLADSGVIATRKWMTFGASAYASGIGEAREVLEGLAAYLQAKRTYFETLQAFWLAQAELTYALGL
jgi:outer membrane protein TolC